MKASSPALIWGSTPVERELPFPSDRHLDLGRLREKFDEFRYLGWS